MYILFIFTACIACTYLIIVFNYHWYLLRYPKLYTGQKQTPAEKGHPPGKKTEVRSAEKDLVAAGHPVYYYVNESRENRENIRRRHSARRRQHAVSMTYCVGGKSYSPNVTFCRRRNYVSPRTNDSR